MKLFKFVRYSAKLMRLAIHAGVTWNIKCHTMEEWVALVMESPLKYELIALNKLRIEVLGQSFPGIEEYL